MLGMLVKVLCSHSIATRRRLPREGNVTFEDLMRGAADFDVRTVTVEILTSVRYLLPITVGIVTVITTMRSAGLSWSHDTLHCDGEVGSLSYESVSEHLGSGVTVSSRFSVQRQLFRAGTLDGVALISNSFLMRCPTKPASLAPFSLQLLGFDPITDWPCRVPGLSQRPGSLLNSPLEGTGFEPLVPHEKKSVFVAEGELRDRTGAAKKRLFLLRGTESSNPSPSSRQSVSLPQPLSKVENPGFPRGCARLAWRPGRQRRAGCFDIAPTGGNISVGPYSSTAVPLMWSARMPRRSRRSRAFSGLDRAVDL